MPHHPTATLINARKQMTSVATLSNSRIVLAQLRSARSVRVSLSVRARSCTDDSKAIIIVYHGYSFGLGIDLGTAADIRICAADVRFSVKEVDIGLAADVGTLSRLPKVVGNMSWVKDVCLTARIFGAEEALRA